VLGVGIGLVAAVALTLLGGLWARRWTPNRLEQWAYGGALALGLWAYLIAGCAALGLMGLVPWTPLGGGGVLGIGSLPPSLRFPPLREGNREAGQVPPLREGNREAGQVPPLREGNRADAGSVPPARRGNLKEGVGSSADKWVQVVLITLSAALALLSLLLCALPPDGNEWDALAYHLAFPKLYLQAGRMVEIPFMHQSYFPPLQDMLYLWGLSVAGESAAKVMHWAVGMLTVFGAAGFLQRRGISGAWAAALVLGAPAFLWQMFSAYADLATALYASLGLFALAYAVQEGGRRWLWLSGALMGFALATKYTALLTAGLWGLIGLVWLVRAGQARLLPTLVGAGLLAASDWRAVVHPQRRLDGQPRVPVRLRNFRRQKLEPSAGGRLPQRPAQVRAGARACAAAARAVELDGEPCAVYRPDWRAGGRAGVPAAVAGGGRIGDAEPVAVRRSHAGRGLPARVHGTAYRRLVLPDAAGALLAAAVADSGGRRLGVGGARGGLAQVWLCGAARVAGGLHAVADGERVFACAAACAARPRRLPRQTPANLPRRALPEPTDAPQRRRHPAGRDARLLPASDATCGATRDIIASSPTTRCSRATTLRSWMAANGYTYLLINRQFTPQGTPEAWRALYYNAIAHGRLQLVFAQRMVEVYALQ
jgi:hypothetical protein